MGVNTCSPEEQTLFNSSHGTSVVCLTRGDSIGLTLVAESGFISLIAVLGVFVLIFVSQNGPMQFSRLIMLLLIAQCFPKWKVDSASDRCIYGKGGDSVMALKAVVMKTVVIPFCIRYCYGAGEGHRCQVDPRRESLYREFLHDARQVGLFS